MISIKKFLEYIVNTTQNIIKSESIKQKLNFHERCEPYAIFSRFDREDKGFLIDEDFIRFLKDNHINIDKNRKTIKLFIEYYDKNFDEKLDFQEFLNFILNKEQNLCRSISSQRETYKIASDEYLEKDLEDLISQTLLSDFYLFEYADNKKIDIFLDEKDTIGINGGIQEDLKLFNLFINIDNDKDGLISSIDLYNFISKRKIKICQNEIHSFIGLFDEDGDNFLDWNEFLFMILPSSSSFEYNLNSLKNQEQRYNEYYFNLKNKCINNNITYYCNDKINYENINPNTYSLNYDDNSNKMLKMNCDNDYDYDNIPKINNINRNKFYIDKKQFSLLAKVLIQIIDSEKNIESIKNKLFSNSNFNVNKIFNYFDKYQNGYISLIDFQEVLESFDINNKNSLFLFSYLDKNNNGKLTQENFISIFLPNNIKDYVNNNNILLTPEEWNYKNNFYQIKEDIKILINYLIQMYTYLNEISKLYEEKVINIEYIFNILDENNKGYIVEEEFQNIFKYGNNDNVLSFDDLLLIMEKIDSNKDGKITYNDLIQLFNK